MSRETGLQHFVRGLIGGASARRKADRYVSADGREADASAVLALIASGDLGGGESECRASRQTRVWLKRARLDADAFAAQHRVIAQTADGAALNLAESPLARLATGAIRHFSPGTTSKTGERVRRLVERAQLLPRVTMTYSAERTAGGRSTRTIFQIWPPMPVAPWPKFTRCCRAIVPRWSSTSAASSRACRRSSAITAGPAAAPNSCSASGSSSWPSTMASARSPSGTGQSSGAGWRPAPGTRFDAHLAGDGPRLAADAVDHRHQAIRALRRQVLAQAQAGRKPRSRRSRRSPSAGRPE